MTRHPALAVTFRSPCTCAHDRRDNNCPVPTYRVWDDEGER